MAPETYIYNFSIQNFSDPKDLRIAEAIRTKEKSPITNDINLYEQWHKYLQIVM